MNKVCFQSSHVLLSLVLIAAAVVYTLRVFARPVVTNSVVPVMIPTQPAVVQPPAQRSTVIVEREREREDRHTADSWPLAPRGNYGYYSRPVQRPSQVGLLTGMSGDRELVLPLFARPSPNRSSRWQYFTKTDTFNSQDVAVTYKGKNCLQELGCEEIYDGEDVQIPAYKNATFKVSMYPNN